MPASLRAITARPLLEIPSLCSDSPITHALLQPPSSKRSRSEGWRQGWHGPTAGTSPLLPAPLGSRCARGGLAEHPLPSGGRRGCFAWQTQAVNPQELFFGASSERLLHSPTLPGHISSTSRGFICSLQRKLCLGTNPARQRVCLARGSGSGHGWAPASLPGQHSPQHTTGDLSCFLHVQPCLCEGGGKHRTSSGGSTRLGGTGFFWGVLAAHTAASLLFPPRSAQEQKEHFLQSLLILIPIP